MGHDCTYVFGVGSGRFAQNLPPEIHKVSTLSDLSGARAGCCLFSLWPDIARVTAQKDQIISSPLISKYMTEDLGIAIFHSWDSHVEVLGICHAPEELKS